MPKPLLHRPISIAPTLAALMLAGVAAGCTPPLPDAGPNEPEGVDAGEVDGGALDAGVVDGGTSDAGVVDGGVSDAGASDGGALDGGALDGGALDGGGAIDGFGAISGDCDVIDDELESTLPFFFVNAIDFGTDPWDDPADVGLLTQGGQDILVAGNAGGSSLESEIFSFEVLARCERATLLKTETTVVYTDAGKITDLLVEIETLKVGVSVTRAVAFPFDDPYPLASAETLLNGKLADILESSALVAPEDEWVKQILHVVAYAPEHVAVLRTAWDTMDDAIKADTIVYVTVSNGADAFLY